MKSSTAADEIERLQLSLRCQFWRRVLAGERYRRRQLQVPRQELVDTRNRMVGDARDHFAHKRWQIEPVEFGRSQQAVDRSGTITAGVATGEQIVLSVM